MSVKFLRYRQAWLATGPAVILLPSWVSSDEWRGGTPAAGFFEKIGAQVSQYETISVDPNRLKALRNIYVWNTF